MKKVNPSSENFAPSYTFNKKTSRLRELSIVTDLTIAWRYRQEWNAVGRRCQVNKKKKKKTIEKMAVVVVADSSLKADPHFHHVHQLETSMFTSHNLEKKEKLSLIFHDG